MRNYLFIDLHIHSVHSFETDWDSMPEDILDNALTTAKKVQNAMMERVDEVEQSGNKEEFDNLIKEYSSYFADKREDQEHIQNIIIGANNKVQTLKDYILNNTKCCISITDHQNIKGSKEALKLIKELYIQKVPCSCIWL